MTDIAMLLARIAAPNAFAAAMTNDAKKERFAIMAAELQDELATIPEYSVSHALTKLKKFIEIIDYGRKANWVAYVMQTSALPSPLAGAEWREDISFNEAEELLREPKLKAVFKLAVDKGCQVVTGS